MAFIKTQKYLPYRLFSFLVAGCLLLASACSESNSSDRSEYDAAEEKIHINTSSLPDSLDISEWVEDVHIIPLKESEGNYIGSADKLLLHNGNYVILDKYVGRRVSVFDSSGAFITSASTIGRGPDEVIQLNDIWIDDKNHLGVYDFARKSVLEFDEDYKALGSKKAGMPLIFTSVSPFGSDGYLGYAGLSNPPYEEKTYKLAFLDNDLNIQRTAFEYDPELLGAMVTSPLHPFSRIDDSVRFSQNYDPFIYNIAPSGEISKRYALIYEPNPLPFDYETSIVKKNLPLFKNQEIDLTAIRNLYKGYSGYAGVWLETKNYVIFNSFDDDNRTVTSLYDKNSKSLLVSAGWLYDSGSLDVAVPQPLAAVYDTDRFISVYGGSILQMFVSEKSPYYALIKENPDRNFIVEMTLKQ